MNYKSRFLAVLAIVILCSFAPAEWVKFQSTAGKFTLMFPKQPTPSTEKVSSGPLPITIHMFMYDASKYKDDNQVYLAMYCDYPDTLVNSDFKDELVDTILNGSINGMATNMSAEVLSNEKTSYKEFPGKNVKMNVQSGAGYAYVKVFLVHNRMYMLEVLCESSADHNASIDKFFNSFVITDTKAAKSAPAKKK